MQEADMADIDVVFKALGDPVRIQVVRMLALNGEMCVCKVMEELGMTQSAVSHHLAALKNAGIIRPRREMQWIHYSLNREVLDGEAISFLREVLKDLDAAPSDREQVCTLRKEED